MAKKVASARVPGSGTKSAPKRGTRARGGEVEVGLEPAPIEIPRPLQLDSLIGQGRAIEVFGSAFTSGRLHHAWIFSGPKGVGKFTAALGFAAAALDPTTKVGQDGVPRPDPHSRVQTMLGAGTHPDFHVVVKELARFSDDRSVRERKLSTIPVDVIEHHVLNSIALSATFREGGLASKAYIVDEAELLDWKSQNQLLKTLEEPPEGSLLVLVTSAEERLLPTVRSRCQRVTFGPLSGKDMSAWLAARPDLKLTAPDLAWLSTIAEGSPGETLAACERGVVEWRQTLAPLLDRAVAGQFQPELGPTMHKLADEWAKADVERNPNASKETANRVAGRVVLRAAAERLRARLRDEAARAGSPVAARVANAIDAVRDAERLLDSNVNGLFVMEAACVGIAHALAPDGAGPRR